MSLNQILIKACMSLHNIVYLCCLVVWCVLTFSQSPLTVCSNVLHRAENICSGPLTEQWQPPNAVTRQNRLLIRSLAWFFFLLQQTGHDRNIITSPLPSVFREQCTAGAFHELLKADRLRCKAAACYRCCWATQYKKCGYVCGFVFFLLF